MKLINKYPKLRIEGLYSPPFKTSIEKEDINKIKEINSLNVDFFWVGLGAPKQEIWMNMHKGEINAIMIGVGAGFDYHADKIKRAPKFMQDNNLEWLYRLIQDPKRLFNRYLTTNLKFIWHCVLKGN